MGLSTPTTPTGFVTVKDAADQLGVSPWDVIRLVQSGEIESLVLIESASLVALKEKS